jgi:hypothetical protein
MKLFGQIVRTLVNVAEIPVALTKDALTLGGVVTDQKQTYTRQQVEKLKDEAKEGE